MVRYSLSITTTPPLQSSSLTTGLRFTSSKKQLLTIWSPLPESNTSLKKTFQYCKSSRSFHSQPQNTRIPQFSGLASFSACLLQSHMTQIRSTRKSVILYYPTAAPVSKHRLTSSHTSTHKWQLQRGEFIIKKRIRTSLVAQWLRIRLLRQGTQVWSLVQEDATGQPSLWATTTEAYMSRAADVQQEKAAKTQHSYK